VDACGDGEEGFLLALDRSNSYDLAVIDRMLPVVDGLTIIKAMRNKQIQIPVIIITGMSELQDKIEGLDSGADDYLSKPFHMEELSARIRALTRRPASLSREQSLSFHDISLDLTNRQLICKKNSVALTPTEFHLMQVFLRQPNNLLTREQLIQKVWETDASVETGNLDNYIYFLRKRIRTIASSCILSSVYGSGYILEVEHGKKS
ncbi:MAG: response regulator transcription factor, partial [Lachnospiraceae bacterium]|nr:response regulator transcription factor [Lachnospiraceae bacterium]